MREHLKVNREVITTELGARTMETDLQANPSQLAQMHNEILSRLKLIQDTWDCIPEDQRIQHILSDSDEFQRYTKHCAAYNEMLSAVRSEITQWTITNSSK